MKKILLLFTILFFTILTTNAQRILINENFENSGFNTDSLPTGWVHFDYGNHSLYPYAVWHVRDTSASFPGVNASLHSRAYLSHRSVSIPWRAGDPVADDYLITPALNIQAGDSLIFWMLFGSPDSSLVGGIIFTNYIDSMQVGYSVVQDPALYVRITTLVSLDSANVWQPHKFSLNAYAGQTIYICLRYYMNTTVDGLWCNIDSVFIGNRSAIGIQNINTHVPKKFDLRQNYPNPFNPITNIEFDLAKNSFVKLIIYNEIGKEVGTLVNETKPAGSYKVDFDASSYPSGVYYYRLITNSYEKTRKMVLVK